MKDVQNFDLQRPEKTNKNSRRSLYAFLISLLFFALLILLVLVRILSWDIKVSRELVQSILSIGLMISSISGLVFSLRSILKKENKNIMQRIGIVGNFVFFGIFAFTIITLIMDIIEFM